MGRYSRRDFIKACGAVTATTLVGWPSVSRAAWGDFPAPIGDPWPGPTPNFKVLELFLYGGVSPWETFFHRPGLPDPWYGQLGEINGLSWDCANPPSPNTQTRPFSNDGGSVHLGPITKPIWRDYITDRMRLVVLKHGLKPHEAAIPYAVTGHVLGRPNFSCLGAAISHKHRTVSHNTPLGYVFIPNVGFNSDNFAAVDATGMHDGVHRPMRLVVGGSDDTFISQLLRPGLDETNRDDVLNYYRAWYRDRLRWQGDPAHESLIRSKGHASYEASANTLLNSNNLHALLNTVDLSVNDRTECPVGGTTMKPNRTATSIAAAAKLLTTPEASGGARYVNVVDGGINQPGGAGYDTHAGNIQDTSINLWATLEALASVIQDPAAPDASKINLDDTLIVIKSEFGRTPIPSGSGRDHWPEGYVNILIGGPVVAPTGGAKNVIGSIDNNGYASDTDYYTPSDLQAALHVAAGVFPFEAENFGVGDVGPNVRRATEEETAYQLWRQILLGLTS